MGNRVIDLWNDADFNNITTDEYDLYMADPIHPTKAGYLKWWAPYIEKALFEMIEN